MPDDNNDGHGGDGTQNGTPNKDGKDGGNPTPPDNSQDGKFSQADVDKLTAQAVQNFKTENGRDAKTIREEVKAELLKDAKTADLAKQGKFEELNTNLQKENEDLKAKLEENSSSLDVANTQLKGINDAAKVENDATLATLEKGLTDEQKVSFNSLKAGLPADQVLARTQITAMQGLLGVSAKPGNSPKPPAGGSNIEGLKSLDDIPAGKPFDAFGDQK